MRQVLWICAVVACSGKASTTPSSADCDLSTDSGVDAAYKKATGKELSQKDRCVDRSTTFGNIARIGMFADDRGCIPQGLLVGCEMNPPGFAAASMAKAGWAKADLPKRKQLAIAWLAEIDDYSIVATKPEKFPKDFTEPTATADGANTVVEFWSVAPAGMEPVTRYSKHRIAFAADGTGGKPAELDNVEVRLHDN